MKPKEEVELTDTGEVIAKQCPIKKPTRNIYCNENSCSWWDEEHQHCSIVMIAKGIVEIAKMIESSPLAKDYRDIKSL